MKSVTKKNNKYPITVYNTDFKWPKKYKKVSNFNSTQLTKYFTYIVISKYIYFKYIFSVILISKSGIY